MAKIHRQPVVKTKGGGGGCCRRYAGENVLECCAENRRETSGRHAHPPTGSTTSAVTSTTPAREHTQHPTCEPIAGSLIPPTRCPHSSSARTTETPWARRGTST